MKKMTDYEKRVKNANDVWKSMSQEQKDAVLEMLETWTHIRCSVNELVHISYEDLLKVDAAWYGLRSYLVGEKVEVKTYAY